MYAEGQHNPLATGYSVYLDRYRQGFETMWRTRAATALGVLGTPDALAALDTALHLPLDSIAGGDSTLRVSVRWARSDSGRTIPPPFR